MSQVAVVTDGLLQNPQGWQLHPDLLAWQPTLLRRRQHWYRAEQHNPLSLLASMMETPAARLLVDNAISGNQYWVVTPWHGQTVRDRVRLMPEPLLDWHQQDAVWLQGVLQPLLDDLQMELMIQQGGAMVMRCADPLLVQPISYPHLEQEGLTNHHPEGADGGKLMRLLAEIQMALHQQLAPHRQGKGAIHGIWLWGAWQGEADVVALGLPRIACRDPLLQQVCDGRDPQWMIGRPEEMVQMLAADGAVPATVVLTGKGRALCLSGRRWLPFANKGFKVMDSIGNEHELWQTITNH